MLCKICVLYHAQIAQLVEHFLGKEEVTDSSSVLGFHLIASGSGPKQLNEPLVAFFWSEAEKKSNVG